MDAPPPTPRCPECGTLASVTQRRSPWWRRYLLVFQLLAVALAIGAFAYVQTHHRPARPMPITHMPGPMCTDFPPVRIDDATLNAMVAPTSLEGDGHVLLDAMAHALKSSRGQDDTQLHIAFIRPEGLITGVSQRGWPIPLVMQYHQQSYEDVYELSNPQLSLPPREAIWINGVYSYQFSDPILGVVNAVAYPWRVSGALVVLIVAWKVGRLASRLWKTLPRPDSRARIPRLAFPMVCTAVAIIPLIATPFMRPVGIAPTDRRIPSLGFNLTQTSLTVGDLRSMPKAGSDRRIATAVLNATPDRPSSREVLAIGWAWPHIESTSDIEGFWPPDTFFAHMGTRRVDQWAPELPWGPSRWSLHLGANISLIRQETTGPLRYHQYSANAARLSWLLLALIGIWHAPCLLVATAMLLRRRRTRCRARRGQCIHCGYEGVIAAAP